MAKHISETDKFVSLNAQVNAANIGTHNIKKYNNVNSLIINATELRHEMRDRDGDIGKMALKLKSDIDSDFIAVTQGKEGAILYNAQYNDTQKHWKGFVKIYHRLLEVECAPSKGKRRTKKQMELFKVLEESRKTREE